jgi:ELWxxDGT repeat protein
VGQGTELWSHNGTGKPTEAARIYPNNGSSPENFAVFNGQLYFSAYDGVHGRELWRYDGTAATLAADIGPGGQYSSSNPSGLTVFDGKLYFRADDGYSPSLANLERAVFAMVAAPKPTLRLAIRPATDGGFVLVLSNSDGSPATAGQMAAIRIIKSEDPSLPIEQWQPWSGPRVLTNGVIEIQPTPTAGVLRCFYRAAINP